MDSDLFNLFHSVLSCYNHYPKRMPQETLYQVLANRLCTSQNINHQDLSTNLQFQASFVCFCCWSFFIFVFTFLESFLLPQSRETYPAYYY